MGLENSKELRVGKSVDVFNDKTNTWYKGRILEMAEDRILVHYVGLLSENDEWIDKEYWDDRIAPCKTKANPDYVKTMKQQEKDRLNLEERYSVGDSIDVWNEKRAEWNAGKISKIAENCIHVDFVYRKGSIQINHSRYNHDIKPFESESRDVGSSVEVKTGGVIYEARVLQKFKDSLYVHYIGGGYRDEKVWIWLCKKFPTTMYDATIERNRNIEKKFEETWMRVKNKVYEYCPYRTPEEHNRWMAIVVDKFTTVWYVKDRIINLGIILEIHKTSKHPFFLMEKICWSCDKRRLVRNGTELVGKNRPEKIYHLYDRFILDKLGNNWEHDINIAERDGNWSGLPIFDFRNELNDPVYREKMNLKKYSEYDQGDGGEPVNPPPPYKELPDLPPPKYKETGQPSAPQLD